MSPHWDQMSMQTLNFSAALKFSDTRCINLLEKSMTHEVRVGRDGMQAAALGSHSSMYRLNSRDWKAF